jgi:hypothetical protein
MKQWGRSRILGKSVLAMTTRHVVIEEDSDLGRTLAMARQSGEVVVLEVGGQSYEVAMQSSVEADLWKSYDPELVREGLTRSAGALAGIDTERLKRELRQQRGQHSRGRRT